MLADTPLTPIRGSALTVASAALPVLQSIGWLQSDFLRQFVRW